MTDNKEQISNIDTGLACFAIMANYFEKPISIDQIKHKYDRQNSHFEEYELLQLAKEFSFKARFVETKWERLDNGTAGNRPKQRRCLFYSWQGGGRQGLNSRPRQGQPPRGFEQRRIYGQMERQALNDDLP